MCYDGGIKKGILLWGAHRGKIALRTQKKKLRACLLQSAFAAGFILLCFGLTAWADSGLLVASAGASAFIAFAFPYAESSRPRYLIGGYLCGCLTGVLVSLLRMQNWLSPSANAVVFCALAVFLAALAMTWFDLEHPPSTALAISLVLSDRPVALALAALAAILALCACKKVFLRLVPPSEEQASFVRRGEGSK